MALRNLPDGKRLGDSLRALEDIQRRADALISGNPTSATATKTPPPDTADAQLQEHTESEEPLIRVELQVEHPAAQEPPAVQPAPSLGASVTPARDPFLASLEALRRTLRHEGPREPGAPAAPETSAPVRDAAPTTLAEAPASEQTASATESGVESAVESSFSALDDMPLPELERSPTPLPRSDEPRSTKREKRRETPAPVAQSAPEQSLGDALDAVRVSVGLPRPDNGHPHPSTPRPRKRRPLSDGIPKSVSEDLPKFRGKPRMRICNRCGHETKLRDPECKNCGKVDESLGILDAVISGDLTKVEQILLVRPHLIAVQTNRHAWTLLHMAASGGNPKMTELLISKGAAVNATNRDGKSPLHYAAGKGHLNVVEALLAHFADPDAKYNGKTAADLAHEHGHLEVETYLRSTNRPKPE